MEISFGSLSSSPACLPACSPPEPCAARPPWRATSPRHLLLLVASTHRPETPRRPCHRAVPPPVVPRAPTERRAARTAATSPPRWQARGRSRCPPLARATALHIPPQANPLVILPFPRSQSSERRRRSTLNAGELDTAVEPPLCSSSAHSDPLASTTVTPRSFPAPSLPPSTTGTPSPSSPLRRRPPSSVDPPSPTISHRDTSTRGCGPTSSSVSPTFPMPPEPDLAGKRRAPLLCSCLPARDLVLEFGKAQGAVCEALDSEE